MPNKTEQEMTDYFRDYAAKYHQEFGGDRRDARWVTNVAVFAMLDLQDWYCPYCDNAVPHADTKDGHHDEAKGGCGNVLQTCKFDPAQAPKQWS